MQPQFSTTTLISSYLFLDNLLLQNGMAFTNYTSQLTYQPDPRLGPGFVAYQAPFKQFVWDSGVSGAQIMNSISGGSIGTLQRGQSGMMVDFMNGRVILPASFGTKLVITGSYAFKDFNMYFANQSQERILFTNKYYLNSRFGNTGLPPPYAFVTPAIFITNANSTNDNFAFGGIYNTTFTISLNVLAENLSQLEGALSIFVDAKHGFLPMVDPSIWPLNEYGDYKSGFNYNMICLPTSYGNPGNLYFISDIKATKVSDYAKIDEAIFLGIVDMTIQKVRTI